MYIFQIKLSCFHILAFNVLGYKTKFENAVMNHGSLLCNTLLQITPMRCWFEKSQVYSSIFEQSESCNSDPLHSWPRAEIKLGRGPNLRGRGGGGKGEEVKISLWILSTVPQ